MGILSAAEEAWAICCRDRGQSRVDPIVARRVGWQVAQAGHLGESLGRRRLRNQGIYYCKMANTLE
jgi:hypothetical protein